ncbi:MAG: response regulator [Bacteroidales bacterium]|nr:response regulator [Bacteroidales bacterium]
MSNFVKRTSIRFMPDTSKVVAALHQTGAYTRVVTVLKRIDDMPDTIAQMALNQVLRDFSGRHRNLSKTFLRHLHIVVNGHTDLQDIIQKMPEHKQMLAGSYFTTEHSIESAAIYNPCIMPDPDQSGLEEGMQRVILSFRATGGTNISTIVFRSGILDANNNLFVDQRSSITDQAEPHRNQHYKKENFINIAIALSLNPDLINKVSQELEDTFNYHQLREITIKYGAREYNDEYTMDLTALRWIAESWAEIHFPVDSTLNERAIFPISPSDANGIEDARFVRFTEDNGHVSYHATCHSTNGYANLPRLITTNDFKSFRFQPLKGHRMMNRGMALFPRKINNKYAMLGRPDGMNNYVLFSDHIDQWPSEGACIQQARFPWEFMQIGNCGSPIETENGWLVITHGVGPMRRYCLGALLLDLEDPTKVIGQLNEPLLVPHDDERNGFVPNVVYSCGSILHNNQLILPYTVSDTYSGMATVPMEELYHRMLTSGKENFLIEKQQKTRKKILLVEDDQIQQKIVASILRSDNYDVEIAADGIIALMQLTKSPFDLILSDINMPNFDGIQMLEYLNQNNIRIPVVFLTSIQEAEIQQTTLQLGAKAILYKPVNRALLINKIRELSG